MADSREYRSKFYLSSLIFMGILAGIVVTMYFLGNTLSRLKMDLTEDQIFTISKPTKEILNELTDDITVTYYASENMPSFLVNLKRDTLDMFQEMAELSNGHFKYEVIAPEEQAREYAKKKVKEYYEAKEKGETPKEPQQQESIEDLFSGRGRGKKTDADIAADRTKKAGIIAGRTKGSPDDTFRQLLSEEYKDTFLADLQQKGIYAVPAEERQASSTVETNFYTAVEIKYLDRTPETIPVHHQIQALEYELASRILKVTRKSKPKVVFFDGRKPEAPPMNPMNPVQPPASDYAAIMQYLGDFFDIDEVSLKANNSLADIQKRIKEDLEKKDDDRAADEKPDKISVLVVAQPNELEERQIFEISKAVSEGIPTIFLVSNYSADMSQGAIQRQFPISVLRPNLDELFRSWGITLGKDLIASRTCANAIVPQRMGQFMVQAPYPMPILLKAEGDEINQTHSLTMRIPGLIFPSTVGLTTNSEDLKKAGLKVTELANSGKQSYTVQIPMFEQNPFGGGVKTPSVLGNKVLYQRNEYKEAFSDPKTLAVLVEGNFPFKYQDQAIPDWKPEEKKDKDADPHGGLNFPGLDGARGPQGPAPADGPAAPAPAGGAPAAQAGTPPPAPADAAPAAPPAAPSAPAGGAPAPAAKDAAPAPAPAAPAAEAPAVPSPPGAVPTPSVPQGGLEGAEAGKAEKAEPKKEPEKAHLEVKNGRVVILSSADMMKNDYLTRGREYESNVHFLRNAIETFGLDERLLQIRRKELTERRFKSGSGEGSAPKWIQAINIGFLPIAVGVFGLIRFLKRRSDSNAYERRYLEDRAG